MDIQPKVQFLSRFKINEFFHIYYKIMSRADKNWAQFLKNENFNDFV